MTATGGGPGHTPGPPLRVLNVVQTDTGGTGIRTKWAFDRHAPDWTYDTVTGRSNYLQYPQGRPWTDALPLWQAADVVHLRNGFEVKGHLRAPERPLVVHHHGTRFRTTPDMYLREHRRHHALALVSTLDLWLIAPDELEWAPSPFNIDWLQGMREPTEDGVLRIAHAPTDRAVKSTQAFLEAVERLGRETEVEMILIEGRTWAECLQAKAKADVYFDQVILGYGNNAIEAWGMGIPVVCGAADDTLEEMERRFGELPFYEADESTIHHALAALADAKTRKVWADRGLAHVRRFHDEPVVVAQLQDVYHRALA